MILAWQSNRFWGSPRSSMSPNTSPESVRAGGVLALAESLENRPDTRNPVPPLMRPDDMAIGESLYFNYLFLLVWIADLLFWWLKPERYETRPAWLEYGIHGYLFFNAFNGAVVFESGVTRIGGILAVLIFAVILSTRQLPAR